jgi:Tfp pilus assembly protein PilX
LNEFAGGERLNDLNNSNGFPCWEVIGMNKIKNKLIEMTAETVRNQGGFSILAIVFVMLVLSVIGYSMARMMATKQKSVPVVAHSSSAFVVAEGGINYGGKYLSDLVSWSSLEDHTKTLGNGSFTLSFSDYCAHGSCPEGGSNMCVTVTSSGTYGNGTRVLASRFCREQGYGCTP